MGLSVARDRGCEDLDEVAAHSIGVRVVVAILGRGQQPGAQRAIASKVGVEGVAQPGHGRLPVLKDDFLDGHEGIDRMGHALCQQAVGAIARATGRHVAPRGDRPVDQGAEERYRRDAVAIVEPLHHLAHDAPHYGIELGQEGLPDLFVAPKGPWITCVHALLRAVQARHAPVQRPFQAEHDAQPLEAKVGAPWDDDLPTAIVAIVARIRRRDAKALQRRHELLVVEESRHTTAVLEHLADVAHQFVGRGLVQAHRQERVGHLVPAIALE